MMTSIENGDNQTGTIKDLIEKVRSDNELDRAKAISLIPSLILQAISEKNDLLNLLLLVIYNLNTDEDNHEILNLGNRTQVFRSLLRLYTETIREHKREQLDALVKLIDLSTHSPELLIELANVLYNCGQSSRFISGDRRDDMKFSGDLIDEALQAIKEKATENLYSDALLMIYSIMALRQQQQNNKNNNNEQAHQNNQQSQ